jgi:hypothetical protein
VNLRESEGARDGGHGASVLALVEERDPLPEAAFRVGEPLEALQGILQRLGVAAALFSSRLEAGFEVLDLVLGEYLLRLDVL